MSRRERHWADDTGSGSTRLGEYLTKDRGLHADSHTHADIPNKACERYTTEAFTVFPENTPHMHDMRDTPRRIDLAC